MESIDAIKKSDRIRNYAIAGGIAAILIIATLIVFFRMKIQLKNNAIELKMNQVSLLATEISQWKSEYTSLKNHLDDINTQISHQNTMEQETKLRNLIDRLLSGRFSSINQILDEYYENSDSPASKTSMYNRVEKELKSLSSAKSMSEIESLVNDALNGIMTKFRNEFPNLNHEYSILFMLNCMGFSQKAISLLMGIKLKSIYTRRARLKERILNSEAPNKKKFLEKLS